jgi:pyruvate/2-oxoglutarate dehydrogenase complex dihydrolipoamide acyltransferase (E2) component
MQAKVKDSWRWGLVRAFAGREYVNYEWRRVPDGSEKEVKRLDDQGLLEFRESPEPVEEVDATDAARELADEQGIDLASLDGTGVDGRVLLPDVEEAAAALEEAALEEE